MATLLIGLDDTDTQASRGTGYLARCLSQACAERGLRPAGVTRHQFLVDPRIPYTSHNSGACVALEADGGAEAAAFAFDFVAARAADGSDPGVCVAAADAVTEAVRAFGAAAAKRVVETAEAMALAGEAGLALRPLGGSGLGVIGALAAVGRRAAGHDGRERNRASGVARPRDAGDARARVGPGRRHVRRQGPRREISRLDAHGRLRRLGILSALVAPAHQGRGTHRF